MNHPTQEYKQENVNLVNKNILSVEQRILRQYLKNIFRKYLFHRNSHYWNIMKNISLQSLNKYLCNKFLRYKIKRKIDYLTKGKSNQPN